VAENRVALLDVGIWWQAASRVSGTKDDQISPWTRRTCSAIGSLNWFSVESRQCAGCSSAESTPASISAERLTHPTFKRRASIRSPITRPAGLPIVTTFARLLLSWNAGLLLASPRQREVPRIRRRVQERQSAAVGALLPLVYDELRKLAAGHMANEAPRHSLDATAWCMRRIC
jgi:ECF sigma factor